MEQKTNFELGRLEVTAKLTLSRFVELERGLGFHHQFLVDDHIKPLISELAPLVEDRHADFPCDSMSALSKLRLQGHHIEVLEKPKSQRIVDLVERTDHRARQALLDEHFRSHEPKEHTNVIRSSTLSYLRKSAR